MKNALKTSLSPAGNLGKLAVQQGSTDLFGYCNFCINKDNDANIWNVEGHRQSIKICDSCMQFMLQKVVVYKYTKAMWVFTDGDGHVVYEIEAAKAAKANLITAQDVLFDYGKADDEYVAVWFRDPNGKLRVTTPESTALDFEPKEHNVTT